MMIGCVFKKDENGNYIEDENGDYIEDEEATEALMKEYFPEPTEEEKELQKQVDEKIHAILESIRAGSYGSSEG